MIVRTTDRTKAGLGDFVLGFSRYDPIPAADIRLTEAVAAKPDPAVNTDDGPDVALARLIEAARNCEGMGIPHPLPCRSSGTTAVSLRTRRRHA